MAGTMSIEPIVSQPDAPANWPALTLDLIRLVRILKAEYVACAELLQVTLGLLRAADKDRDRARASMIASRDEARALRAELAALRGVRHRDQVSDTRHLPTNATGTEAVQ